MAKKEAKHYVVVKSTVGGTDGYYSSRSGPAAAAKKAATRRFTDGHNTITLTVRETGTEREFTYQLTREKLAKPFVSKIAGKEVVRRYVVKSKAM